MRWKSNGFGIHCVMVCLGQVVKGNVLCLILHHNYAGYVSYNPENVLSTVVFWSRSLFALCSCVECCQCV